MLDSPRYLDYNIINKTRKEESMSKDNKKDEPLNQNAGYLVEDIKEVIIETDEKDPKVIARINEVLIPSEGYRVRVKFVDN